MIKVVLFTTVVVLMCTRASALYCYVCDSEIHGSSCYDPINLSHIRYMNCKDVYNSYQRSISSSENKTVDIRAAMQQNWNPTWNSNPTEFECVQYEKVYYRDNRRRFIRKCQGRNQSPNFCGVMQDLGNYQGFTLTKCNVCYSDYCNSANNIQLSIILNLVFFFIFYRCTDFQKNS